MYLVEISLDGERKENWDAIRMLEIISERNLDIDEELCACFIDWQKAFGRVNWHCTQSHKFVVSISDEVVEFFH
jgi:hypothetical protein